MNPPPPDPLLQTLTFSAADCAVFGRVRSGAPWGDLAPTDQAQLRDARLRLKSLAEQLTEPTTHVSVPMAAFVSTLNPSGRVPRELWSCVFPREAGNKSYA